MRKNLMRLLCLIITLSIVLAGCAAKDTEINKDKSADKAVENTDSNLGLDGELSEEKDVAEDKNIEIKVSNDIKEQAKKEGVSVKALQKTLDGLAEIGANKYKITKEEYIKKIEANGDTLLSEWQVASEYMDISITELYEYEKAKGDNLTSEQKEVMQGMDNALKMAEEELSNTTSIGNTDVGNLLGIDENDTGEILVVNMSDEELKEALNYQTYKILQDYSDEFSVVYEYVTDSSYEDIVKHYIELVENTKDYLKIEPMGSLGVMLQGTINDTSVYIEIDNSDPGKVRVNNYIDLTTKK